MPNYQSRSKRPVTRCACGRCMSRWADRCTRCHREHMDALRAIARQHVARGTCPLCASPLVRNLALAGWWQCARFGEPSFRRPEFRDAPHCSFQTFTE